MAQFHESYAWQKLLFYHLGPTLTLTIAKSNLPTVNGTVSRELCMAKLSSHILGSALTLTVAKSNLPAGQCHESYAWQKLLFYSLYVPSLSLIAKYNLLPTITGIVSRELCMGRGESCLSTFWRYPNPTCRELTRQFQRLLQMNATTYCME